MKSVLPDFLRDRLGREITIALVIKLAVIAAIFYAFFDGRSVPTDADAVAERITNPSTLTPQ